MSNFAVQKNKVLGIFELIFIAVGLSLGSLAASLSAGVYERVFLKKGIRIASIFALFHILMSVLGWLAGFSLNSFIGYYLLWFSFSIIFIIGLKMIFEAIKVNPDERRFDFSQNSVLILLAIASAIDTFIVGISFGFLNSNIIYIAVIFGFLTFIFSLVGLFLGNINRFAKPRVARFLGGLILIFIAIKILIENHN